MSEYIPEAKEIHPVRGTTIYPLIRRRVENRETIRKLLALENCISPDIFEFWQPFVRFRPPWVETTSIGLTHVSRLS
jgi:hypothetical protein